MRIRPAARALVAGAGLVATGLAITAARADILVDSPIIPTASIVSTGAVLPTSYVVPTSTILPTSYVVPTSSVVATSSSYYVPTSYTTSYYRGGLFRPRRYVERTSYYDSGGSYVAPTSYVSGSILPTSYVSGSILPTTYVSGSIVPTTYVSRSILPTTYVVPTVSTSTILPTTIVSRPVLTPTSVILSDSVVSTSAASGVCCTDGGSSAVVESASATNPTPTGAVVPRSITSAPKSSGNAAAAQPGGPDAGQGGAASIPSPERSPSVEVNPTEAPATPVAPPTPKPAPESTTPPNPAGNLFPPASAVEVPPPGKSGDPDPGPAPKLDEATKRTSYRPTYSGTGMPSARNVLRGKVVAWRTDRPEEGVQVVIAHATGAFRSRPTMTDARGEFSVSLPDGDWIVQVRMPSGSLLGAGQGITATNSQILDEAGESVKTFLIRR